MLLPFPVFPLVVEQLCCECLTEGSRYADFFEVAAGLQGPAHSSAAALQTSTKIFYTHHG